MFQELIDNITNVEVFTQSIKDWVSGLSVNSVIILVMMIFMIVGAVDKIRGNKHGYGEQFEEGFNAMGPLAMAMAGVRCCSSAGTGNSIKADHRTDLRAAGRRCIHVCNHTSGL